MNNKFLYGIIAVAFVGGMFTVAYAGPIMPKITLAGNVDVTGDLDVNGPITSPTITDLENQEFQISSVGRNSEPVTISPLGFRTITATCESDEMVTGGGHVFADFSNTESQVIAGFTIPNGWRIIVINNSESDDLSIRAHATCSKIVPVP